MTIALKVETTITFKNAGQMIIKLPGASQTHSHELKVKASHCAWQYPLLGTWRNIDFRAR